MNYRTTVQLNRIMAKLTIFLVVTVALIVKDGTFSCSLRSHKDKSCSSLCSSSPSDLTPHRTSVLRPHKIPSPCDSSSKPNLCTPNVTPGLPNVSTLPPKPTHIVGTPLPVPTTAVLPPTSIASIFYQNVLSHLIKLLLSSPTRIAVPTSSMSNTSRISGQVNTVTPCNGSNTHSPSLPSSQSSPSSSLCGSTISPSGINSVSGQVINPHNTSSPGVKNSNSLSTLSSSPCGTVPSSTAKPTSGLHSTPTPSTSISGVNITNLLIKLSSLISTSPSTPKLTPLSLPCPLFTPILNKHGVPEPILKLHNISHPHKPSSDSSSSLSKVLSNGLPCGSPSSTTKVTVPTAVLVLTSEAVPQPAPEEFSTSLPVPSQTSNPSNFSCRYPAVINLLQKLLFPHQLPNVSTVHLTPTLPPLRSLNITPAPPQVLKPHTPSTSCKTGLSSCLSNDSFSSTKLTPTSLMPPFISVPTSGVSSGYNPEYMKLLLKYLLSTPSSLPPQLSPSTTLSQPLSNFSSTSPPIMNQLPTPATSYSKLSELNSTVVIDDAKSNKSNNSASTLIIVPNTTCTSSYGSLSYILCRLESLGYGLNLSTGLQTPFPNISATDQNIHREIPTPTPCPPLPTSGLDKCRQKLSRLPKLPAFSSGVDPLSHYKSSHTPHTLSLSPCSSHSKLSSGCKN